MAANIFIKVALHPQGQTVSLPTTNGNLSMQTLSSQFPTATGLKYMLNGSWMAVPVEEGTFHIPENMDTFIAVSASVDRAHQILGNSLASQVATTFRTSASFRNQPPPAVSTFNSFPPPVVASTPHSFPLPLASTSQVLTPNVATTSDGVSLSNIFPTAKRFSRKALRAKPGKLKTVPSKTYKVVFIHNTDLPTNFTKRLVLLEGIVTVNIDDDELIIMDSLKAILQSAGISAERIIILSYVAKRLSVPCAVPGFSWNGQQLKTNIGQGKLYVMVSEYQGPTSPSSSTDSLDDDSLPSGQDEAGAIEPHQLSRAPPAEEALDRGLTAAPPSNESETTNDTLNESSGTPTISFHPRHSNRLSLRRTNLNTCTSFTESATGAVTRPTTIEVVDSEDEELLQRAIEASLMEVSSPSRSGENAESEICCKDVLSEFASNTITSATRTDIIVSRLNVLDSTFRGFQRSSFKLNAPLYVKFSGEQGQDYGGPRREFLRLALDALHTSALFMGQDGNKYFRHDVDLLEKGHYRLGGQLVAVSFAQDGPGPHFFNESLYELMTKREADLSVFDTETLPTDVKDVIKQLKEVETLDHVDQFLVSCGDWLLEQGFNNVWKFGLDDKEEMISKIIKQIIYYRCSAEITEFTSGMNDVGNFWDIVKQHAGIFKAEFCFRKTPLIRQSFESLCSVAYSEVGSNYKRLEDQTIYSWEIFLQDIEEKRVDVCFGDLLAFITGADQVPPRGFSKCIDIKFFSSLESRRLPSISSCALELYLPRGIGDPEMFRGIMLQSLKDSQGFEKI